MSLVTIKKDENNKLYLEGDFEFKVSELLYNPEEFYPKKKISFDWSVESPSDAKYEEMIEMIAEKLKNDFIDFCKNYKR